jgi:hypothetical protein
MGLMKTHDTVIDTTRRRAYVKPDARSSGARAAVAGVAT